MSWWESFTYHLELLVLERSQIFYLAATQKHFFKVGLSQEVEKITGIATVKLKVNLHDMVH